MNGADPASSHDEAPRQDQLNELQPTTIISQVTRPQTSIQPLAILRAESRCVSVQNTTVCTPIVTSIKPGTSRLDRDQAEQTPNQKDSLKMSRAEQDHSQEKQTSPGEQGEDQAEQMSPTSQPTTPENTHRSDQHPHAWPDKNVRAEPLLQPEPDQISSPSTPPNSLQSLAIIRAVPRCVPVQLTISISNLVTSPTPGIYGLDRGRAEQPTVDSTDPEERGEDRAEQPGHTNQTPSRSDAPRQDQSSIRAEQPVQPWHTQATTSDQAEQHTTKERRLAEDQEPCRTLEETKLPKLSVAGGTRDPAPPHAPATPKPQQTPPPLCSQTPKRKRSPPNEKLTHKIPRLVPPREEKAKKNNPKSIRRNPHPDKNLQIFIKTGGKLSLLTHRGLAITSRKSKPKKTKMPKPSPLTSPTRPPPSPPIGRRKSKNFSEALQKFQLMQQGPPLKLESKEKISVHHHRHEQPGMPQTAQETLQNDQKISPPTARVR